MQEVTDLKPEVERKLMDAVERMPAFPRSVQKVLELSRNLNCPPKDLVTVIEKDPVMTMKILRVINSAYYSLPKKITSVSQSVVYLGINTVKNLALAFAAVGALPKKSAANFDIQKYLMHSLGTASIARHLTSLINEDVDPGDAYIAGLLHDFGKVVFAQFMSNEYIEVLTLTEERQMSLDCAETEVIGVNHAFVGSMLARKWQFPNELVNCIGDHHDPDAETTGLLDCLRIANQIARLKEVGDGRNPFREDEQPANRRFGDDFDSILAAVGNVQRLIDEAVAFANVGVS